MRGTEKIIAHIQADAKSEADAIIAQAELACNDIRRSFEKEAEGKYEAQILEGKKKSEEYIASMARLDSMNSKKEILAFKQEMVGKAFDEAKRMIPDLPKEQYLTFLTELIVKASSTHDEKIVLNEKDAKTIGPKLVALANSRISGAAFSLSDETGDFIGGLILRQGDTIEVNCTIEIIVDLMKAELSADVVKILFA